MNDKEVRWWPIPFWCIWRWGVKRFFSLFAVVFNFWAFCAPFVMYHSKNASESSSRFFSEAMVPHHCGYLTPHIILALGSDRFGNCLMQLALPNHVDRCFGFSSRCEGLKVIKVHSEFQVSFLPDRLIHSPNRVFRMTRRCLLFWIDTWCFITTSFQVIYCSLEPYILCPWAPIWSTLGTHVNQIGTHVKSNGHPWAQNVGPCCS